MGHCSRDFPSTETWDEFAGPHDRLADCNPSVFNVVNDASEVIETWIDVSIVFVSAPSHVVYVSAMLMGRRWGIVLASVLVGVFLALGGPLRLESGTLVRSISATASTGRRSANGSNSLWLKTRRLSRRCSDDRPVERSGR